MEFMLNLAAGSRISRARTILLSVTDLLSVDVSAVFPPVQSCSRCCLLARRSTILHMCILNHYSSEAWSQTRRPQARSVTGANFSQTRCINYKKRMHKFCPYRQRGGPSTSTLGSQWSLKGDWSPENFVGYMYKHACSF